MITLMWILSVYVFIMYTLSFITIMTVDSFAGSRKFIGFTTFPVILLALLSIINLIGVK